MAQTDVLSSYLNATGALGGAGRTRVKTIRFVGGASAGSVVVRDGSASGNILIKFDTGASEADTIWIPGEGVLFQGDPHFTLTNVTSVTVFYG